MKEKKNLILKVVFTSLSVLVISFIFGNSLLDASASTVQSTGVREFINSILSDFGFEFEFTENFVRKCAHLAEYFVLAVSLFITYVLYIKKHLSVLIATLSTGLVIACIDETIQLFSDGRSSQISDVILDFSAVLTVGCVLYIVIKNFKKRGNFENE